MLSWKPFALAALLSSGWLICAAGSQDSTQTPATIRAYLNAVSHDPIAELQDRLDRGKVTLQFKGERGYLDSVLKALNIPVSSQTLVFSKTSVQKKLICPNTPRALYFNDQVYVGWTPGSKEIELSSTDAKLGGVFYILPQRPGMKPMFIRHGQECLQCHISTLTLNVPGHLMRSVTTQDDGGILNNEASYLTTDRSPLAERWGGWYVTGECGGQTHLGNQIVNDEGKCTAVEKGIFERSHYLRSDSDVAALMVLGHQTSVQTLMMKISVDLSKQPTHIAGACEPLVRAFLMVGEHALTEPIKPASAFAVDFARRSPHDTTGRSLRQLDLKRRLFRYPCSYLIYSPQFDALPIRARDYIYGRLAAILKSKPKGDEFSHLSLGDRAAMFQILVKTKPEFHRVAARIVRQAPTDTCKDK